jgi:hypothetical protein
MIKEGASAWDSALFRRQFVAGPRPLPRFEAWRQCAIGPLHVHCHPDLPVSTAACGDRRLVLLGEVFDYSRPSDGNQAVADRLIAQAEEFTDLEAEMANLAGRWLAFASIGSALRAYPDAAGLRPVFFASVGDGEEFWLGSQPRILREALDARCDAGCARASRRDDGATHRSLSEKPYGEALQLLPNHFLDLNTRTTTRFWPQKRIEPVELQEAAERISAILRSTIDSAAQRAPLYVPLTGGYDSRILFACAAGSTERLRIISIVTPDTPRHDVVIPRRLARHRGLDFHVIPAVNPGRELVDVYRANTGLTFWDPSSIKIGSFSKIPSDAFLVSGLVGEVMRCFYSEDGVRPANATPQLLARMARCDESRFGDRTFLEWFNAVPRDMNIDILDLLYWEHRMGNWAAIGCTGLDTACNVIAPYNCRELLEIGLGVDVSHRTEPCALQRRICKAAMPDILDLPFNHTLTGSIYEKIKNVLPWRVRMAIRRARWSAAGLGKSHALMEYGNQAARESARSHRASVRQDERGWSETDHAPARIDSV